MKYVAVDQYGHMYKLNTDYPRKELLQKFAVKSARKIYRDTRGSVHVGYYISGAWLLVYKCEAISG